MADVVKHSMSDLILISDFKFFLSGIKIPNAHPTHGTRHELEGITASCRLWQLEYILMCTYDNAINNGLSDTINKYIINLAHSARNTKEVDSNAQLLLTYSNFISSQLKKILNIDIKYVHSQLYQIIIMNNYIGEVTSILKLPPYPDPSLLPQQYINYPMCIYLENDGSIIDRGGTIFHYFTLIYKTTGWFLNSAYGSDYVSIPQYTTKLVENEFNFFCQNFHDEKHNDAIKSFFNKYFLQGGLEKRHDTDAVDENPKLRHQYISIPSGLDLEMNIYLFNRYRKLIRVGYLHNYNDYINTSIQYKISRTNERRSKRKRHNSSSSSSSSSSTDTGGGKRTRKRRRHYK